MSIVKTSDELAAAIKSGQSTIEIEGNLAKKVIRLKATGPVAWAVAIGCIGIAGVATAATFGSGGTATPVTAPTVGVVATGATVALGGAEVATVAAALAVAAGGVSMLSKLYSGYRIAEKSAGRVVLVKK